ncbi:MAG: FAD-dependent oxidoreductase, partial [Deltaproteobacteria bacterium]|nr:FAD-dependent oxidoreductase [Deltaproteobacteria bacterium]
VPRLADNVGRTSRWSLMKSLKLMGVALRPRTKLLEIRDDSVLVETAQGEESIRADRVVMAIGVQSLNDLAETGKSAGIEVIVMGDAKEPRSIPEAVREGFEGALRI